MDRRGHTEAEARAPERGEKRPPLWEVGLTADIWRMEIEERAPGSAAPRSIPWPLIAVYCAGIVIGWVLFWPDSGSSGSGEPHNWPLRFALAACFVGAAGGAGIPFRRSFSSMSFAALAGLLTPCVFVWVWIAVYVYVIGVE